MIKHKVLLAISLSIPSLLYAESWYAMARHGECHDLTAFSNNNQLIIGAKTPMDIKEKLEKSDIEYTLKPMIDGQEGILSLTVPSEEWSMILVTKKYCQEITVK